MSTFNRDFILTQWVPALRSGTYEQGQGWLRTRDTYCCLGVACDLVAKTRPATAFWDDRKATLHPAFIFGGYDEACRLGDDLRALIGVSGDLEDLLVGMNDAGASFSEIADVLEAAVNDEAVSE